MTRPQWTDEQATAWLRELHKRWEQGGHGRGLAQYARRLHAYALLGKTEGDVQDAFAAGVTWQRLETVIDKDDGDSQWLNLADYETWLHERIRARSRGRLATGEARESE